MEAHNLAISTRILDKVGIGASALCALHCLLMPLLVPLVAFSGLKFIAEPTFEIGMITFMVVLASFTLTKGFCYEHRQALPFYFFSVGLIVILLGMWSVPENLERYILPLGAIIVAIAHGVNWRMCSVCASCRQNLVEPSSEVAGDVTAGVEPR